MAEASVSFSLGAETASSVLEIDLGGSETILTGDIGGLIPAGTTARLRGACRLVENLHVRGTLICDPTGVVLDGQNLFDIHTHDGTLNLQGQPKTSYTGWGGRRFVHEPSVPVVNWQVGDRLAVTPTVHRLIPPSPTDPAWKLTYTTWTGDWATMTRPASSPDVALIDGRVALPEVINLSQTVTLRNLKRLMVHEASAPNPQTLKWIRVLDSGETGVLGHYPVHFHMLGEHSRGSLVEGVVVEGGKNHAFVTHASHGVTIKDSAAVNIIGDAYWWDPPPSKNDFTNDTDDTVWEHCLAAYVVRAGTTGGRTTGFNLGRGLRNKCIDCTSVAVQIGTDASGFLWPETGVAVWDFHGCIAHNVKSHGIFAWQNPGSIINPIDDFLVYRCGIAGIEHGAYVNRYHYKDIVLHDNPLRVHAKTPELPATEPPLTFENILCNSPLLFPQHVNDSPKPTVFRSVQISNVAYERENDLNNRSYNIFEDCRGPGGIPLAPSHFNMATSHAASVNEIKRGGVLVHRWANGVWS